MGRLRRCVRVDRAGAANYNPRMTQNAPTDPAEYARIAVDTASDRLASDIVMLDIRGLSDFADYFIILTGESTRQLRDVSEAIEATLEAAGAALHHREGAPGSGWMLQDYGDLIVHLFGPDEREYYDVEGAWSRAVEVVRLL